MEWWLHLALGAVQALLIGFVAWAAKRIESRTFDPSEVARIRRYLFGTEAQPSELHRLKDSQTDAEMELKLMSARVEGIESERRESNKRLDKTLHDLEERLNARLDDVHETCVAVLNRLPGTGTRGGPQAKP